jgi:hypothetical protein
MRIFVLGLVIAAAAQGEVRSWTPKERALPASLSDSNPMTWEIFCQGSASDPIDVGLSWATAQPLNEFVVEFVALGGRIYEPDVAGQTLEIWADNRWQAVSSALEIDYRGQGELAPVQSYGASRWRYRFPRLETTRLRLLLTQPRNEESWHRCYAVRELRAGLVSDAAGPSGISVTAPPRSAPGWLEPGANLAVAEAGARLVTGNPAEIVWPHRMLVSRIAADPPLVGLRVAWWDGQAWRDADSLPTSEPGVARFLPVATRRLRVTAPQGSLKNLQAFLDGSAARYFRETQRARADLLGLRFRNQPHRDLAAMRALLLPLDFAKTAIGRPADLQETMVCWNGTFLMTEPHPPAEAKPRLDRWFTFAAGAEKTPFGADWAATRTRYLEGYLPATITEYRHDEILFEQMLWVTAPGPGPYGTAVQVRITNPSSARKTGALSLAMGRRPYKPPSAHPLSYAPEETGYRLDADRRTVRTAAGDIVLYAEAPGAWGGTAWENHLGYTLELAPKQTTTLRFFVPSVESPVSSAAALRTFDWEASLKAFRTYWEAKLGEGVRLELPEPELETIYKNLLAQALIITLDGDSVVQYGAYSYESYFGIEEGWPAVALAQFGQPAPAQQISALMLSPDRMDKQNYHHQYRNGLAPFYAVTIYRLTGDRRWLEGLAPALEEAAEWTIRTLRANTDARFGGLLPRHAYGGDIRTPAYSFYSNATCWRGLHDTALAMRLLGRSELAERYQREADRYRDRLLALADELAHRDGDLVFLPMSFDVGSGAEYREKEPPYAMLGIDVPPSHTWVYLGNYWNLFAPMLLELKLFERNDPRARWVPDYMEARGGVAAGLVRFTIGLDQIYGKGYYESLLEQGRREEFLTSLYGILAHGMSENLYSFPEVAGVWPLRTEHAAWLREYRRNLWDWGFQGWDQCEGEPLSAGPGMALQMLRMALVRETLETAPQDGLRLLDGAPRHWFAPGKRIRIQDAPTFFGKVSVQVEAFENRITAEVSLPEQAQAREVVLRLPHPSGKPLREVLLNGGAWRDFAGEEIRLPRTGEIRLTAVY